MNARKVSIFTLLKLFLRKKPFGPLGFGFIIMSIVGLFSMITIISNTDGAPYESYDNDNITNYGTEKDATITAINPITNVTVNGEHPVLISYNYTNATKTIEDKFETFDLKKAAGLKQGDSIKIKAYKNQSVITGLSPYGFPKEFIYLMPLPFLIIGTIFFLIALIPALRMFKLYKNGIVKEATIFSMMPQSGLPISNLGKGVIVNYYYFGATANKIFGSTTTPDFSILHEKRPDDTIKIFVSETDETKSCMVPMQLAIKNNWKV